MVDAQGREPIRLRPLAVGRGVFFLSVEYGAHFFCSLGLLLFQLQFGRLLGSESVLFDKNRFHQVQELVFLIEAV